MSIQDLAEDIVDFVQQETSGKVSANKITKQVLSRLNTFVRNISEIDQEDLTIVVQLHEGTPVAVFTNHPTMEGASYVCTDNISVADDEASAIVVSDENIVVGTGVVGTHDNLELYTKAYIKYNKRRD